MSGRHTLAHVAEGEDLVVEGSPLHRLPPEVKLVAGVGLLLVVLSVPERTLLPYLAPLVAVLGLGAIAHVRVAALLRRLRVVVPVLAFVLLLPFLGPEPDVEVLGIGLSEAGLRSMASLLATGLLGASVAVLLAATTDPVDLLAGLRVLHVPAVLVAIALFMLRFLVVVEGETKAMAVARRSRGHRPRWLADVGPAASSVGALFVRSFERSERVHAALLSRGWTGEVPDDGRARARSVEWAAAAATVLVVLAATVALRVVAG